MPEPVQHRPPGQAGALAFACACARTAKPSAVQLPCRRGAAWGAASSE